MMVQDQLNRIHDRVREHTAAVVNDKLDAKMRASIEDCISQGKDAVSARLQRLEQEWDIDRALFVKFAVVGGAAFLAGMYRYSHSGPIRGRRKGMLYLLGSQLGFLFLHGTVGWCPPVPVFRRLGFRTTKEIETEKAVLRQILASDELLPGFGA